MEQRLPDLGPYFARRWFADDRAVLTDLAVPSEFVMLFKDWSAGKMSFVAGSDSPKEGKGGRPRYGRPRYSDFLFEVHPLFSTRR